MDVDLLIFGGGIAGLWLLDEATRAGHSALLLETSALGSAQTIGSQGILHGGFRYALKGRATASAEAVRAMPSIWLQALNGHLRDATIRAHGCHVWWTNRWNSYAGYLGSKVLLGWNAASCVRGEARPIPLRDRAGLVVKVPDVIVSPASVVSTLAGLHRSRIRFIRAEGTKLGDVVTVQCAESGKVISIRPGAVALTAGRGNGQLRELAGLDAQAMQLRPLHMLCVRGDLPELNAHCADSLNERPRITVTSDRVSDGTTVWQIGGVVAEDGVNQSEHDLIERGKRELATLLPSVDQHGLEWSAYRVDRAEGLMPDGRKPPNVAVRREGRYVTGWPTKLVLAPLLAKEMLTEIRQVWGRRVSTPCDAWPQRLPLTIAAPPWESATAWRKSA